VLDGAVVSRTGDPVGYGAYQGLLRARRNLHVQAKAVAPSPTGGNALAPFNYLARRHFGLAIAPGFLPGISQAARKFPELKFAVLDSTRGQLHTRARNVEGTVFHVEEPAYLAGYLAARMADRGPRPHVVSSVGGAPIPTVQSFIAGFQAGARRANPRIGLLNSYTNDFVTQAKCEHAALQQIAQGSRVVFDVAGNCGLGALKAAKLRGIYGVGVDTDQSFLGRFILTSVVKNQDQAVFDLARRLVRGRLRTGGNLSSDLRNHGVLLGKFSPKVSRALRRQLIPLARQIEQGKIIVPARLPGPH
jgi:basic membrane protein A and related proteins